ncbi:hypothetical protein [Microvirga pakistanensis]|uniref:hypothetical protein n=1 Tax=Microvirga pakistanensis TaxID=1682650 RepID=UPI00106C7A97|nr:hypothetical protein [Microvirga pakistanensis]
MFKFFIIALFASCTMTAAGTAAAQSQTGSPEKISASFPKVARTPVKFLRCKGEICAFQSETPMAAVIFSVDGRTQNIRMFSVTFHASKAQIASGLIRDALRFSHYPEINDIDPISLMRAATPSGRDVEVGKGLGARLINFTYIDKNVFGFRFYPTKN